MSGAEIKVVPDYVHTLGGTFGQTSTYAIRWPSDVDTSADVVVRIDCSDIVMFDNDYRRADNWQPAHLLLRLGSLED